MRRLSRRGNTTGIIIYSRGIRAYIHARVKTSKSKDFFLDFLTLEDETDMLPRNVGTEIPLKEA
jgi:hypothetical protein